jgi:hypothetical protein
LSLLASLHSASVQSDPDMAFDLELKYFAEAWW